MLQTGIAMERLKPAAVNFTIEYQAWVSHYYCYMITATWLFGIRPTVAEFS